MRKRRKGGMTRSWVCWIDYEPCGILEMHDDLSRLKNGLALKQGELRAQLARFTRKTTRE